MFKPFKIQYTVTELTKKQAGKVQEQSKTFSQGAGADTGSPVHRLRTKQVLIYNPIIETVPI